jgi:hypothetical protein
MPVMGSDHVFHIDDIDRKSLQPGLRFEYAAVTDATGFMLAQPSFSDTLATTLFEFTPGSTVNAMLVVKPIL